MSKKRNWQNRKKNFKKGGGGGGGGAATALMDEPVIDVDASQGRIYLHILHAERAAATAEHVAQLAELTCAALPVPDPTEVPS